MRVGESRVRTPGPTVFVGAGVGDVIGVFVGAVVAAMRATPVHGTHSSSTVLDSSLFVANAVS